MSEENAPEVQEEPEAQKEPEAQEEPEVQKEEESTMPSAAKQIKVMAIIVVGITIVLGGGVWLSTLLR